MSAPTKDDVYAALRKQGIKAIKVVERVQPVVRKSFSGLRKRDWAVVAVVLILAVAAAVVMSFRQGEKKGLNAVVEPDAILLEDMPNKGLFARPRPRHRLGVKIAALDLAAIFTHPAERYLANFAQPGTDVAAVTLDESTIDDFIGAIGDGIQLAAEEDPAIAELKRIVAGLKEEARLHLKSGKGIREYAAWLVQRQKMEKLYRDEIIRKAHDSGLSVEKVNETLDSIGFERVAQAGEKR